MSGSDKERGTEEERAVNRPQSSAMEKFRLPSLLLIMALTTACKETVHRSVPSAGIMPSRPAVTASANVQTKVDPIFTKTPKKTDINRAEIAEKLPELLKDLAEVTLASPKYNPHLPNLYIVPQQHFHPSGQTAPADKAKILAVQRDILKILHVLKSIGTDKQFAEGIEGGQEVDHVNRPFEENPVDALPKYQQSGEITRAYMAFEGIYGPNLRSEGVDSNTKYLQIREEGYKSAETNFLVVMKDVVGRLADWQLS